MPATLLPISFSAAPVLPASCNEDIRAFCTNRFAVAKPMPLLPPVTSATLPSSLPMIDLRVLPSGPPRKHAYASYTPAPIRLLTRKSYMVLANRVSSGRNSIRLDHLPFGKLDRSRPWALSHAGCAFWSLPAPASVRRMNFSRRSSPGRMATQPASMRGRRLRVRVVSSREVIPPRSRWRTSPAVPQTLHQRVLRRAQAEIAQFLIVKPAHCPRCLAQDVTKAGRGGGCLVLALHIRCICKLFWIIKQWGELLARRTPVGHRGALRRCSHWATEAGNGPRLGRSCRCARSA